MILLIFAICLGASTIGGICGIGGGVIIKPLLDAFSIMTVSTISFLSGLTVLSMSVISVFKSRKSKIVDLRIGSSLAIGAILGGIIGNYIFSLLKAYAGNDTLVGLIQAIVLALITFLTLIYSMFLRNRIKSYTVNNLVVCIIIGMSLGILSSFLGIGGGPINLAVLFLFFSMPAKKAAANSIYIIMFSQISNLITTIIKGNIPAFSPVYLIVMVGGGVLGGMLGSNLNKKISDKTTEKLFQILLMIIIAICIYNAIKFSK